MKQKIIRFSISGIVATAVHFSVAWMVFHLIAPQASIANAVAFVVANIVSYVLHTLWTFSSRMAGPQFLRFVVVSGVGFALSVGIPLVIGPEHFWLSTIPVLVAVPASSFLLHNFWTFRS